MFSKRPYLRLMVTAPEEEAIFGHTKFSPTGETENKGKIIIIMRKRNSARRFCKCKVRGK